MQIKPKVIFGPFIGEFGWELMHWMNWVNNACETRYKEYDKIVISYPGRSVLYPSADQFIEVPQKFIEMKLSSRNYILDGWSKGYPGISDGKYVFDIRFFFYQLSRMRKPHRILKEVPIGFLSTKKFVEKMFKEVLADNNIDISNVLWICPWKLNYFENDILGYDDSGLARFLSLESNIKRFPNNDLSWNRLTSDPESKLLLNDYINSSSKLVCIFPRKREIRRPDKNWPLDKYTELILKIQREFPEYTICICGEPGGAYFSNKTPPGCVDLININPSQRLGMQIAALERSLFAVGSLSGAMFVPLLTMTPTIVFGLESERKRFDSENYLNTIMDYLPLTDPSVDEVFIAIKDMVAKLVSREFH